MTAPEQALRTGTAQAVVRERACARGQRKT